MSASGAIKSSEVWRLDRKESYSAYVATLDFALRCFDAQATRYDVVGIGRCVRFALQMRRAHVFRLY